MDFFAAFEEDSNEVGSQESGSSCDEYVHCDVEVRSKHRLVASTMRDVDDLDAFAPFVDVIKDALRTKDYEPKGAS